VRIDWLGQPFHVVENGGQFGVFLIVSDDASGGDG
jgi:hypothetical protein